MPRKYVTCPKCGMRNDREGGRRKCANLACRAVLPKRRVPQHATTLRDHDFDHYRQINMEIHGRDRECGVCGREPHDLRNMDRDHGHDRTESSYGKPRGLACPGDWGCNKLMSRLTLARARQIVAYLERVEAFYAQEPVGV